jgi:branched-chain amino acid transport system ATP-binding protein
MVTMRATPAASDQAVLEAVGLARSFGGVVALQDYAIRLEAGDLIGLIGPNGAGKTTVFNLLSSVLRPDAGRIYWQGADVTDRPTHALARLGLARTFQNVRLFPDLSVIENVMAGLHMRHGEGLLTTLLGLPRFGRAEAAIRRHAHATLELAGLQALAAIRAGDLAYGDQRRVEIARALATEPRVLLLDEPAAGMNPSETQAVVALIRRIHEDLGIAVLVVEHDMRLIMGLCRRIQVLDRGRFLAAGTPEEIQADPAVVAAYLGTRRRSAHARDR